MKRLSFVSRLATSAVAVALTLGSTISFTACSDDEEVNNEEPLTTLSVPVVAEVADSDITETSLQFSWDAVSEATTYSAQIRLSESGDIYREQITENTTVKFEGLTDNTTYYFRVRANYEYNESRNSAYSDWVVVTTVESDPTLPALDVPSNVICDASQTTTSSLTFVWDAVDNAKEYTVLLTSIGLEDVSEVVSECTKTFTGLEKGRQYFFTVQAREVTDGNGAVVYKASAYSGSVKATTTDQLATPTNLINSEKMAQAARFEWDAVEGAATYYYELYTVTSDEALVEGTMADLEGSVELGVPTAVFTSNTSVTFYTLSKSTYYAFRVKAIAPESTATIDSEYTDFCVIRTLETDATPLALPVLTVTDAQQLKIVVSWAAVGSAYGYDWQFGTPDMAETDCVSGSIRYEINEETGVNELATSVTLNYIAVDADGVKTALSPNTNYRVRVKTVADPAVSTDADSSWSEWFAVQTAPLATELTVDNFADLKEALEGRMADQSVLTVKGGTYNFTSGITFKSGTTVKAAAGETVTLNVNGNAFNIEDGLSATEIGFENLTMVGANTAGKGDHIFNVGTGVTAKIGTVRFSNCTIRDIDRSVFRTQNIATAVENFIMENTTVAMVAGCSQTYGVYQNEKGNSAVATFRNCTFDNVATLQRQNAVVFAENSLNIEHCTFYGTRGTNSIIRFGAQLGTVINISNSIFAGAVTKVYYNSNYAAANESNNFAASDFSAAFVDASTVTVETMTSAELFPNAASGNYAPASGSAAAAAQAGDTRWY